MTRISRCFGLMEPASLSGLDYPSTYRGFVDMFPDDASCAAYLARLRWPQGFVCPACKTASDAWNESRGRLECRICHYQTSVTAGTIMDKTRTPLTTWFEAAWHLTTAKNGLSAKTLERTLGIAYRTAWAILQRYRVSMVRGEREQLSGTIEVDETLVGGVEQGGKRGRGSTNSIVVVAVEIKEPKGFGRIRMRHIPDASGASLRQFVRDVAAQGATVHTDGWTGYNGLRNDGYVHEKTVLSSSGGPAHVAMPGVHRVVSLLKRWVLGTHQGSIVPAHLQSNLEEFTFRFNRRTSKSRGLVFRRLLEQAVVTGPVTAADVTFGYHWS
jgi:transposase-like protein